MGYCVCTVIHKAIECVPHSPNRLPCTAPHFPVSKGKVETDLTFLKKINGSLMHYILIINKCYCMFNYFIIFY